MSHLNGQVKLALWRFTYKNISNKISNILTKLIKKETKICGMPCPLLDSIEVSRSRWRSQGQHSRHSLKALAQRNTHTRHICCIHYMSKETLKVEFADKPGDQKRQKNTNHLIDGWRGWVRGIIDLISLHQQFC